MKKNDIIKAIAELNKLGLLKNKKKNKKHKKGKKSKKNKKHKKMMSYIDPVTGKQVFVADSYTTHSKHKETSNPVQFPIQPLVQLQPRIEDKKPDESDKKHQAFVNEVKNAFAENDKNIKIGAPNTSNHP